MPTAQEMINWLAINGRIVTANQWSPVYNPNIASPYKDWIQVGISDGTGGTIDYGHFRGKSFSTVFPSNPNGIESNADYDDYFFWIQGETYFNMNFPESTGTLCDLLILGNSKYRYLTDISLNGLFNITVSNTTSIVKSDNSETNDYNLDNQPATNNPITGQTATYTLPRVIIRYKTIKGEMTPYTPSSLLEYKNTNYVVNEVINSKITTLEEQINIIMNHLNL